MPVGRKRKLICRYGFLSDDTWLGKKESVAIKKKEKHAKRKPFVVFAHYRDNSLLVCDGNGP